MLNSRLLQNTLANPKAGLRALDKYESEQSLINFMKLGWAALEPGVDFVPNWGVAAVCDHLEAVTSGQIRRLLINVPPGCTKSMTTNVFWPAWEWGPKALAHYRYISFAHEVNLATRDNVRCRNLINSEWYQDKWGDNFTFRKDQNGKEYYENTQTGFRQSCAANALTGRRGDRVIADDPHSVEGAESDAKREEMLRVFSETVPTRLNKPAESAIVVIMQRIHERDVSGHILAKELGYEHLMLPMRFEEDRRCFSVVPPTYMDNPKPVEVWYDKSNLTWSQDEKPTNDDELKVEERYNIDIRENDGDLLDPTRFPETAVAELETALSSWGGTYPIAGQLQQRPVPRGGGMFKKDDFKFVDTIKGLNGSFVRGWDLAASDTKKSPWTVGAKLFKCTDGRIIIVDVARFRKTPGAVEQAIQNVCEQDGMGRATQDFPQDPGQAGKVQSANYGKLLHGHIVRTSPESGDKLKRAEPFAAQVELGNVYLLRGEWNDTFLNEAQSFPNGVYKDQIDACSRAYGNFVMKRTRRVGRAEEVT